MNIFKTPYFWAFTTVASLSLFGLRISIEQPPLSAVPTSESNPVATPAPAKSTPTQLAPQNIPTKELVARWSPQVARVTCFFSTQGTPETTSLSGTGFFTNLLGRPPAVMTNKHLMASTPGGHPTACSVAFLNGDAYTYVWPGGQILYSTTKDKAIIVLTDAKKTTSALLTRPDGYYCTEDASIGDKLVVLGYPSIGASTGITATEGIISGVDGDYYVVSAKFDKGSSGGIAIDTEKDCIIGMPTMVTGGAFESLGRILSAKAILGDN